jgi:hypothetical protein
VLAALIAEYNTEVGTQAEAFWDNSVAKAPPETAKPRRANGFASMVLTPANRLATVPSGQCYETANVTEPLLFFAFLP